jgi:hypothetical protein
MLEGRRAGTVIAQTIARNISEPMIRFLFRLLGFLILAGGFVALVIDGTRSIAAGALSFTSTETSWAAASPDSLERTRAMIAGWGVPGLADPGLETVLAQPTFLVLGVIGVLFMLIGRRGRRPVGVAP